MKLRKKISVRKQKKKTFIAYSAGENYISSFMLPTDSRPISIYIILFSPDVHILAEFGSNAREIISQDTGSRSIFYKSSPFLY